jgi:inositol-phosphate phosphatase / L-galactose 1-phosphate phosphatase / histidinol-phosphatase
METQPLPDAASPPDERADFAAELARRAGQRALDFFRQPVTIEAKADDSPVTIADRTVERLLREAIADRFPGHAILGEEYGTEGGPDAPLWIVDPIDGTRSFVTGWPVWGTLLALVEEGRPRLGVIEMPALGESWLGIAGEKTVFTDARHGRKPARASACGTLEQARFYTTSPDYFDAADGKRLAALTREVGIVRYGGDCYSYGLLALGHVDLVVEAQLEPYDFLPLVPVVQGAGGVITDWQGADLTRESDGHVIAASTPDLHAAALARLRG